MNRLLFILMLLPGSGALAQTQIAADTTKPALDGTYTNAWLARARPSHTTSKGTIYIMPIDRMPCLVPDIRKTRAMPTMRPRLHKRMPNGFEVPPVKPNSK